MPGSALQTLALGWEIIVKLDRTRIKGRRDITMLGNSDHLMYEALVWESIPIT